MDNEIVRLFPLTIFGTFEFTIFEAFPSKTNTRKTDTNIDRAIGVDTDEERTEKKSSSPSSRNPGDETPWPSSFSGIPLLQG